MTEIGEQVFSSITRTAKRQRSTGDLFILSAELKSPGGQPLAHERVLVIDPDTSEVVVGPVFTSAKGELWILVPKEKSYHLQIADDDIAFVQPSDHDLSAHVHAQFVTATGELLRGETVQVRGNGISMDVVTGDFGNVDVMVPLGAYDLVIGDQTFKAHAMRTAYATRGQGRHHVFVVESDAELDDHS